MLESPKEEVLYFSLSVIPFPRHCLFSDRGMMIIVFHYFLKKMLDVGI